MPACLLCGSLGRDRWCSIRSLYILIYAYVLTVGPQALGWDGRVPSVSHAGDWQLRGVGCG